MPEDQQNNVGAHETVKLEPKRFEISPAEQQDAEAHTGGGDMNRWLYARTAANHAPEPDQYLRESRQKIYESLWGPSKADSTEAESIVDTQPESADTKPESVNSAATGNSK